MEIVGTLIFARLESTALPQYTQGSLGSLRGGTVGIRTVDEELLRQPHGTPGWRLAGFKARISEEDLDVMAAEIEAACEQVRPDEWVPSMGTPSS